MKEKKCPRCGATFICSHDDIVRCQCATVALDAKAREYIATNYTDCLCARCLAQINKEVSK